MQRKFLGVFVNPLLVQSEGITNVFDNLQHVGADAIATSPYVAAPGDKTNGMRFPDLHVDGHRRILARPVWGEYELMIRRAPSYPVDESLFQGQRYSPARPVTPVRDVVREMMDEAHARNIQVHLMVQPSVLPKLQPEDVPIMVDGSQPTSARVSAYACLNNPATRDYGLALIENVLCHYKDAAGLFTDWVEYGAYGLIDNFGCFCPHCRQKAEAWGYDWQRMHQDVGGLWAQLHTLDNQSLATMRQLKHSSHQFVDLASRFPGWLAFLQFKAQTVTDFYRQVREKMDGLGLDHMALSARGWPPPWNRSSGMDYRQLAAICTAVTPKLFLFDYAALPRWYGETLQAWNPQLTEQEILDMLLDWMDLPDDRETRRFADYYIPGPTEPHTARLDCYRSRLDEVSNQVKGQSLYYPFAHAYLPDKQWLQMVELIRDSPVDGMWVQMYAYLSDSKLNILRDNWR